MKVQVTKEGIMLDDLVYRALGRQDDRLVEQTLGLNPGLAEIAGSPLPYGHEVEMPRFDPARPRIVETVKLWD